jgi:tetratricopeptide (TPR) repeat protein
MKNTGKNAENKNRPSPEKSKPNPAGGTAIQPGVRNRRAMLALISVLLFLAVLGVFLPALNNGFVEYDDNLYITKNTHVQQGLTWQNAGWAFRSLTASNWHPLTWLSHLLDYQLYGLKPWGHHLTSVLLHACNAALVFWVLVQMTGALWRSLFVAALFGLHPMHVESVAWAAERKDVLSAFFWLLTLLAYGAYVKTRAAPAAKRKAIICYCLTLLLFALGLMSKPMVVTLPFVLLLLDYWPLGRFDRQGWVSLAIEKTPFFLLTIAASSITFIVQKTTGAVGSTAAFPWGARLANTLVSYCCYIGKLLWPENLSVFYPYPGHWPVMTVLAAGLLLLGVTGLVIVLRRSSPWLLVGWLWFIGVLVPVIGLVQVGKQAMADRYSYIPSIGLFILISWGVNELTKNLPYRAMLLSVAGAAAIGICSALTLRQLSYWKDSEALFRHAVEVNRNNGMALANLGAALLRQGRWDEAIIPLRKSLKINPALGDAHNFLGAALKAQGKLDEALGEFQQAIQLNPSAPDPYSNLGDTLAQKGQLDAAIPQFEKALEFDPDSDEIRCDLGMALLLKGETKEAILQFQAALSVNPRCAEAQYDLGYAYEYLGHTPEAISHYQRALELQPDYPGAKQRLANLTNSKP